MSEDFTGITAANVIHKLEKIGATSLPDTNTAFLAGIAFQKMRADLETDLHMQTSILMKFLKETHASAEANRNSIFASLLNVSLWW